GLFSGSAQLEAEHAAETGEQLAGARVTRMALEAGVVHSRDGSVTLQELRDSQRALVLMADAKRERHQAAIEQEGCVRVHAATEMVHAVGDALDPLRAADHR